ncbi:hypothetical protein TELCIR_14671 [Teladorsagia circumcincta]|uniref:Uncharacterized protein n=1 Tax=Teladorsagia circumcincta TaxID=45464 RepID=A0A2G9U1Y9_TELCI|nr:hypothetical protein TELCIR_14671 [Teladorsagia circumcincta]
MRALCVLVLLMFLSVIFALPPQLKKFEGTHNRVKRHHHHHWGGPFGMGGWGEPFGMMGPFGMGGWGR